MGTSTLNTRILRLRSNLEGVCMSLPLDTPDWKLIDRLLRHIEGEGTDDGSMEHLWFWRTVAESVEDPRKVSFAYRPEDTEDDDRRRFCSMAKFLKGRARQHGAKFTDEEADRIAFLVGTHFPAKEAWEFEEAKGEELADAYYESPYWGSCMSGKRYFDMLANNPNKVSLVKILRSGEWVGRALLWTTNEGTRVLDRVYPSDTGHHVQAAWEWALKHGYDYREGQTCGDYSTQRGRDDYKVTLKVGSADEFPYLDTFKYTNDNPRIESRITLRMDSGTYTFNETDGAFAGDEETYSCCHCGDRVTDDDCRTNDDGEIYCETCYGERYVYLSYRHHGQSVEGEYRRNDCSDCHHCGETRYDDHMTDVEGDMFCDDCVDDHAGRCDECEERFRFANLTECDGGSFCEDCLPTVSAECEECGARHLLDNMEEVDSLGPGLIRGQQQYACSECMVPCRHCGEDRPASSECRSCASKTQLVLIAV